jgi:hypothetical protein
MITKNIYLVHIVEIALLRIQIRMSFLCHIQVWNSALPLLVISSPNVQNTQSH